MVAVHVTDPRELTLPDVGMLSVVDPETGRLITVETRSQALRDRYAAAARERSDGIAAAIRTAGAEYLPVSTDRDWLSDVIGFATAHRGVRRSRAIGRVSP